MTDEMTKELSNIEQQLDTEEEDGWRTAKTILNNPTTDGMVT